MSPTCGPSTYDNTAETVMVSPRVTANFWPVAYTPCNSPDPGCTSPPSTRVHGSSSTVCSNPGSSHRFTGEPGSAVIRGFTGGAILSVTTRSGPRQSGLRNFAVTPTV